MTTHWGSFLVESDGQEIKSIGHYDEDENPSIIGQALLDSRNENCRVAKPAIRKGYLEQGINADRTKRGEEPFIEVSWETALDLAGDELRRVRKDHGNAAVYGGSYGWASAGRFHHAQSQLHRFLKKFGGYTESDRTYSAAAGEVLLPRILGNDLYTLFLHTTPFTDVAEHGQLVVAFGGISAKNLQVVMGGPGAHTALGQLKKCRDAGVNFINISPIKDDVPENLDAEWMPIRPSTDTALILALCHTLFVENLHDENFLAKYCVGFERVKPYLLGSTDGQVKDAKWASTITNIPATKIISLARTMATNRTFVTMSWSLQRAEHGEQPYWAGILLMSMLGQYGLPGAGVGHGVGCLHTIGFIGRKMVPFKWGSFEQGENPINSVIPVARVTDMLENPGAKFDYDGQSLTYPDIRLIYWAGGNPYHHHQDLNRLRKAWAKAETVIVNEQVWTATARHADIVFPITTSLERNDVALSTFDPYISPMPQAVEPYRESRHDYEVFSALAQRLDIFEAFTENKNELEWVRSIYEESRLSAAKHNVSIPEFDEFWRGQQICLSPQFEEQQLILDAFREDPETNRLGTPSGKIELYSEDIASFNYADCPGHPVWLDKQESLCSERANKYPLHLVSNQPRNKLHSQLDFAKPSMSNKVANREPARLNPKDAEARGISNGDLIRLFNDRGACLASAELSDELMEGIIQLSTGAWFDPMQLKDHPDLDLSGNPNVLTIDIGTSSLAQGPSSHSCLVDVERYLGPDIAPRTHQLPALENTSA